jgi:glycosyltransferase involved in cell wall biosynthesis
MPLKEAMNRMDQSSKKIFFKRGIVTPVSISDAVHEVATTMYGSNVKLIPNGRSKPTKTAKYPEVVNFVNSLKANGDYKVIANVANYRPAKNQVVLVNAIKQLNEQGHNVKLLIIGGREEGEIFESLKKTVDANTLLVGTVNNVQDYLYAVDFFCLPSLWEGMPISLIEAFAVGCVPICAPASSIVSMIENNVSGFLTEGFTDTNIVETLKKVIQIDDTELEKIRERAILEFKEKYSIEICARNYLKMYTS